MTTIDVVLLVVLGLAVAFAVGFVVGYDYCVRRMWRQRLYIMQESQKLEDERDALAVQRMVFSLAGDALLAIRRRDYAGLGRWQ